MSETQGRQIVFFGPARPWMVIESQMVDSATKSVVLAQRSPLDICERENGDENFFSNDDENSGLVVIFIGHPV